jgi:hypothetical protein
MRAELKELLHMLTFMRPMGSGTERVFIDRFVASLPGAWIDHARNWHVTIGENNARILWSSHTDTVHHESGRQTLAYDSQSGIVRLSKRSKAYRSNCLGADCTVGVWIMRNMILRGVPGHYVFHYGEERGGIGSTAIAEDDREWLRTFDFAIAFDRRGTRSIITEQGGCRTASNVFAASLAEQLNPHGFKFQADNWGVFTDTANYADDVPECTNVSVGYAHEHSMQEQLDCRHAIKLLNAMCAIDLRELIMDRDPDEEHKARILRWQAVERAQSIDRTQTVAGTVYHWPEDSDRLVGVCIFCRQDADIDPHTFECADCEDNRTFTSSDDRSVYLDPQFAEAQAELIEQLKRRKR